MAHIDGRRRQGQPCWIDLAAPDAERAAAFYADVLGWDYEVAGEPYGGYRMARVGDRLVAGIGPSQDGAFPPAWTLYFAADDAAAMTAEAGRLGGMVVTPPMEVPGQGHMSIVADPTGAVFGLWQPIGHTGFGLAREPGSMSWCEVLTPHAGTSRDFYGALLGATVAEEEGTGTVYFTHYEGEGSIGGIAPLTVEHQGIPPHWVIYFAVADLERALDAVRAAGGNVVSGPYDSPHGRLAAVSDPFGAHFSLVE